MIFDGQTQHYDEFCIVENLPAEEDIIEKMLYICFDGTVKSKYDYEMHTIAEIEDPSQLELLLKAGTTYFYAAERRYLDPRRQLIELPYLNGSFQMTVHLANNIILDKDTVIAFNPETSEFEISGRPQDYDMIFTHDYKGIETKSVRTTVTDHQIKNEVKVSTGFNNILQVTGDGLYANVQDRVTYEAFDLYKKEFDKYKGDLDFFVEDLKEEIEYAQSIISPEAVTARILVLLESKYPGIEEALANYDAWAAKFVGMEDRIKNYVDTSFNEAETEIKDIIDNALTVIWGELGNEGAVEKPDPASPVTPGTNPVIVDTYDELPDIGSTETTYLVKIPKEYEDEPQAYDMYEWRWFGEDPANFDNGEYRLLQRVRDYSAYYDYKGPIFVDELPEEGIPGATYFLHKPVEYETDIDHYEVYTYSSDDGFVFINGYTSYDVPVHTSKSTLLEVPRKRDLPVEGEDYMSYVVDDGIRKQFLVWKDGSESKSTNIVVHDKSFLPSDGTKYNSYTVEKSNGRSEVYVWKDGYITTTTEVLVNKATDLPEEGEMYKSYTENSNGRIKLYAYSPGKKIDSTVVTVSDSSKLPENGKEYINYTVLQNARTKMYAYKPGSVVDTTKVVVNKAIDLPENGKEFMSYEVVNDGRTQSYIYNSEPSSKSTSVIVSNVSHLPVFGNNYSNYTVRNADTGRDSIYIWK
jgi:hypothetical protein